MRYSDYISRRVDVSRLEERHPQGWLGSNQDDPGGAINMSIRLLPPLAGCRTAPVTEPDEPKR